MHTFGNKLEGIIKLKERERKKNTLLPRGILSNLHGLVLNLIATAKTADKSNADTLNGSSIGA